MAVGTVTRRPPTARFRWSSCGQSSRKLPLTPFTDGLFPCHHPTPSRHRTAACQPYYYPVLSLHACFLTSFITCPSHLLNGKLVRSISVRFDVRGACLAMAHFVPKNLADLAFREFDTASRCEKTWWGAIGERQDTCQTVAPDGMPGK